MSLQLENFNITDLHIYFEKVVGDYEILIK